MGTTKTKKPGVWFSCSFGDLFACQLPPPSLFLAAPLAVPLPTQVPTVGTYLPTSHVQYLHDATHPFAHQPASLFFCLSILYLAFFFPSSPGPPLPTPPSRFGSRRNTYLFAPSSRQPGSFKAFRRLLELLQRPAGSLSPPATLLCRPFSCTRQQPPRQPARDTPATGKRGVSAHHSRYVPQQSLLCLHAFPDSCVLRFVCIRGQLCPA